MAVALTSVFFDGYFRFESIIDFRAMGLVLWSVSAQDNQVLLNRISDLQNEQNASAAAHPRASLK